MRIEEGKRLGLIRSPLLPDVPTVMDFAKTDRERQILKLIFSRQDMGWPFTAPSAIPEDRKAALRTAFASTMKDEAFLKEARLLELEVNLMTGDDLEKLVDDFYATPEPVVTETRNIVERRLSDFSSTTAHPCNAVTESN